MNPARINAPLAVGRVLRDVGGGPAIFAPERQALQHAHRNGRLIRGWMAEYCAGAVDVIPLVPPLYASREPAHNRRNVS